MSQFDKVIDRRNTDSLKYDFATRRKMPEDVLPMWVADMDFQTPQEVIDALIKTSEHGIYGYSDSREDYFTILIEWFKRRFSWDIESEWIVKTPGVVYAVATAIRGLTKEGDSVLIQEPVYYPFRDSIEINERNVVVNELVYSKGKYSIDFDDFEDKIISNQVKLFILCSPHNPVGRVWSADELSRLGSICVKHKVIVVADEIHADFTYEKGAHRVFTTISESFRANSIVCTSPTKTFNMAGLQLSNIIIENASLRHAFKKEIHRSGYSQLNLMGIEACKAAYQYGDAWVDSLIDYLRENLNYIRQFLNTHLPKIKLVEPEGTYLVWLDFSELMLEDQEIQRIMVEQSKLWLDHGTMFGKNGKGFQRINIACPRKTIEQAMTQLLHGFGTI